MIEQAQKEGGELNQRQYESQVKRILRTMNLFFVSHKIFPVGFVFDSEDLLHKLKNQEFKDIAE